MTTETQIGQHSEPGQERPPVVQVFNKETETNKDDKLDLLLESISHFKKKSEDIAHDFQKLEKRTEKQINIIYIIVTAIALVFVVTTTMIALDYFNNNEKRYENFINKTEEIKQNFYTKEQMDGKINSSFNEIKNQFDNFKNCLKSGRYYQCF